MSQEGHFYTPSNGTPHSHSYATFTPEQFSTPMGINNSALANPYDPTMSRIPGLAFGAPLTNAPPFSTGSPLAWQPTPFSQYQQGSHAPPEIGNMPPQERVNPVKSSNPPDSSLEEGELSDGEFEDLYEPRETGGLDGQSIPAQNPSKPSLSDDRPGSEGDADGSSIYDTASAQDEPMIESSPDDGQIHSTSVDDGADRRESAPTHRARSGSYSPYLSPSEVHQKIPDAQQRLPEVKEALQRRDQIDAKSDEHVTPDEGSTALLATTIIQPDASALLAQNGIDLEPTLSSSEIKKKAQEAILALLPWKVRYQNYIDEGIDKTVVQALFKDLGLDMSIPKKGSAPSTAGSLPQPTAVQRASTAAKDSVGLLAPTKSKPSPPKGSDAEQEMGQEAGQKEKAATTKTAAKSAAEERKERIARKLAAKAQKPAASESNMQSSPKTLPPGPAIPVASTTPRTKSRAETNALLHQKLAALKKAQENAASSKKVLSQQGTPSTSSAANAFPQEPVSAPERSNSQPKTGVDTESGATPNGSYATLIDKSVPTFTVTPNGGSNKSRSLKRPVASDFDAPSIHPGMPKRSRTQETLIIDVSDDEDVEMDIGSPGEESNSNARNTISKDPESNLAAFPPLSDSTTRWQHPSPSSVPQPPQGGMKLGLLHGRIEEMKRRIAEAEAKKRSGRPETSVESSRPQSVTGPDEANTDICSTPSSNIDEASKEGPMRLPKLSDSKSKGSQLMAARRDRIVSFDLPAVEAAIREKQEKLQQLVAQAAQLEIEVQESLAMKQRLNLEKDELGQVADDVLEPNPIVPSDFPNKAAQQPELGDESASKVGVPEGHVNDEGQKGPGLQASTDVVTDRSTSQLDVEQLSSSTETPVTSDNNEVLTAVEDAVEQDSPSVANAELSADMQSDLSMDEDDGDSEDDAASADADGDAPMETSAASSPSSSDDDYEPQLIQESESREDQAPSIADDAAADQLAVNDTVSSEDEPVTGEKSTGKPSPDASDALMGVQTERADAEVLSHLSLRDLRLIPRQVNKSADLAQTDPLSYHSPLTYFRSYRMHPGYSKGVAGGLKSLTYSSKINPMQPVCEYSLAGEPCPKGADCQNQHFENMVLGEGDIITQLGSAEMFSGVTRDRFVDGLRKVLNELKNNKIKDFDRIAKAIIDYRADFLGDKSKVLPLDGVSI